MSVQRWTMQHLVGKVGLTLDADSNGEWVTYSDHARIVAEKEQAHAAALLTQDRQHMAEMAEFRYRCDCIGDHDDGCNQDYYVWRQSVTAAAPRTLTADDPEPGVGSVVLFDGLPYIRQGNKWVAPRANSAYWYEFMRDERPTVLIHDGEDR